jgi:hypothetical protein
VERFNIWKLNELEVTKSYKIKISKSSAVMENLNDSVDINRAWENIKTSAMKSLDLYEINELCVCINSEKCLLALLFLSVHLPIRLSVCLSTRKYQHSSHGTGFPKILYRGLLQSFVEKFQIWLK